MGKFCTSCGSEILPEHSNCTNCGVSVSGKATLESTTSTSDDKSKYIGLGVVVIVGIILISIISSLFSPGYKKPLDYYIKGMNKASAKTIMKAYPKDDSLKKLYSMGITDKSLEKQLDADEDEYGKNVKYSYKIVDKEKIKKSDLKVITASFNLLSKKDIKVSKGYELTIDLKVKGKDGKDTQEIEVSVYKVNGKWCLLERLGSTGSYDYDDYDLDDLYDLDDMFG